MSRSDCQVNVRIPLKLKAQLDASARAAKRSLTAEIVHRLSGPVALRDEFAMAALQGFLADSSQRRIASEIRCCPEGLALSEAQLAAHVNIQLAHGCYALADAMLAAREAKQ